MMKITNTELTALNKDFYIFQSQGSKSNRQNPSYFISQLNQFEKKYKKAGLEKSFAEKLFTFAEKCGGLVLKNFRE